MEDEPSYRPDGEMFFFAFWGLLAAACLAGFIAFSAEVEKYGAINPEGISIRFWSIVIAAALLHLAVFLGAVGAIIRAIYFLPGRHIPRLAPKDPGDSA